MRTRRLPRLEEDEPDNHERWMVSYADFMTLLFAFFVVLYATSQADLKKEEDFERSIKKEFTGLLGFGAGPEVVDAGERKNTRRIASPIELFPESGTSAEKVQRHVEQRLKDDLPESEKATVAGVHHDAIGVAIELASSKLFASGSAELRADAAIALDRLGKILKDSGRKIIVEGHTDNVPIRTQEFASNWELSAARATKIVRYLIARHQISSALLVPVSYADQKPVATNETEAGRARNRRIEIKIVTGDAVL